MNKLNSFRKTKKSIWHFALAMIAVMLFSLNAQAQYVSIPVTGFNNDVVANGGAAANTPNPGVTFPNLGFDGVGYTLISTGYVAGTSGTAICAMPTNNLAPSLLTSGLTYALQGYGTPTVLNNNALSITSPSSTYTSPLPTTGTLSLATPASYGKLYFLVGSVVNNSPNLNSMTVTVTFNDASTQVFSSGQTFVNWFSGTTANAALNQINRVHPNNTGLNTANVACPTGFGQPVLFEYSVFINSANYGKLVSSITFTNTSISAAGTTADKVNYLHIMGVGGLPPCTLPAAQPTPNIPALTAVSTSQITGSFAAAAGSPTGYLVVRYPAGATPAIPDNGTTYTTGQTIGLNGIVIQSSTALNFAANGLNGATSYDFYVYSYLTSAPCNGPVYLTTGSLFGTQSTNACGNIPSPVTVGPGGTYATLSGPSGALAAIATTGISAPLVIEMLSSYIGTGETYPITLNSDPCVTAANNVTIRPEATAGGVITITSNNSIATIDIVGGKYFTIDGRPSGTGSSKFLRVENTGTTGQAVILRNEASSNKLTYLDARAANANASNNSTTALIGSTVPGVIAIGNSTGLNGNDNNTISFCDIHSVSSAGNLGVGFYSYNATTGGSLANNDFNIIDNNNIYDFYLTAAASAGINISFGCNNYSVTNNKIYQTVSRNYTGTQTVKGMWISPSTGGTAYGSGFTLTGNTIGYADALGTGTMTLTGGTAWLFVGIDHLPGAGATNLTQNNTITNIAMTTTSTSAQAFSGILIAGGNVTVNSNTIGSNIVNGAISFTTSGNLGGVTGYRVGGTGSVTFSSNVISGVNVNSSATTVGGFAGIHVNGGTTVNVTNNTIGSTSLANSINLGTTTSSASVQAVRGIFVNAGTTTSVIGNTVANMNVGLSSGTGAHTMQGISVSASSCSVNNNTITNLTSSTVATGSGATSAIVGIAYTATTAPMEISGNTIHTLKLTNPTLAVAAQITGLAVSGPASGSGVSKNKLHSFSVTNASNVATTITGITVVAGSATYSNNMVRLGYDELGNSVTAGIQIRGITKGVAALNNFYYNSVFIGGIGVIPSALNSFAFQRSTAPGAPGDQVNNNIFVNSRSNAAAGAGYGKHYVFSASANTFLNANYNAYYFNGTGGLFGLNLAADVAIYTPNWISGDANSQVGNPQFLNPTGTSSTWDLHLNPAVGGVAESAGIAIVGINDDIDGNTRQGSGGYSGTGTAPDVGADEYAGTSAIPTINSVVISPNTPQCVAVIHPVTATVTAALGAPITTVVINYSVNGVAQAPIAMSLTSGTASATSVWNGTIPVPSPVNATIVWSVTASDGSFSKTQNGVTYADAPLLGAIVTAIPSSTSICSGTNVTLTGVTTASPLVENFENASFPLTSFTLGNIAGAYTATQNTSYFAEGSSSIRLTTASLSANGFIASASNIDISQYASAQLTFKHIAVMEGPTTSYDFGYAEYSVDGGANWITFPQTSYVGTAAVAVFTGGNARFSTRSYPGWISAFTGTGSLPNNALWQTETFNIPVAALTSSQFKIRFRYTTDSSTDYYGWLIDNVQITGSRNYASYAWSSTPVGFAASTQNTNANPTVSTTYTFTATNANGCSVSGNSPLVVVNDLPNAPSASAPSSQCGYGVPTVSVTSTSGTGSPVFKWYSALTGGTLLQTGPSATFTTAINSSQTFYVSEIAGICESSPRTAVVANVNATDAIHIVTNTQSCVGTANPFSVNQVGTNQSYTTYTWSALPAVGSGVSGNPTGPSQTFLATANGSYAYAVIATDGICTAVDTQLVSIYTGLTGTATPTQITSCVNPTGLITANVSGAGTVINNDFSNPVLPSNMTSAGNDFAITGGQMRFTSSAGSKNGGVLITNPTGLANNDFQIDFDMITTPGSNSPADGFSYSYGPDVVALPTGLGSTTVNTPIPDPGAGVPENGSGTALKLGFDAYPNGANTPGIYLMYNCSYWNQIPTTPGVLYYSTNTTWRATPTLGATTHVTITINALGQVSMWLNNVQVVTNQQLPASYLSANKATWKHAFCGRTGGEWQGHYIDNLLIQYNNFYEYSINGGASWSQTNPIIPPTSGTYSVDARYVSVPGCFANLDSVTITSPSFTTNSTLTTICGGTTTPPTLSFSPTFGTGAVYQWQSSPSGAGTWTNIPLASGTTYTPAAGSVTSSTDFRCEISCGGIPIPGSPSSEFTVNVTPAPVVSAASTSPSVCYPGGTPSTLSASGDPATYAWTPTSGLSSSTGASVDALPSSTTTYTVTATALSGCTSTTTETIVVIQAPLVTTTATPTSACLGGDVQLNAVATAAVPYCTATGGTGTYYMNDFSTTGGVTNITNTGTGYAPSGYGNYTTMQVTQAVGSSVSWSASNFSVGTYGVAIFVDWNQNGLLTDAGEQLYNSGGYVTSAASSFTVPAGAYNGPTRMRVVVDYFNTAPGACDVSTSHETEDYTFVVTGGIPNSAGSYTFNWSTNPTYLSATNIANPVATNIQSAQTYTVIVNDPGTGCATSFNLPVSMFPIPSVTYTTDLSNFYCENQNINFNANGSGSGSYSWTGPSFTSGAQNPTLFGAQITNSGDFTVNFTDGNGCIASQTQYVEVNPNPVALVTTTPVSCINMNDGTATFDITVQPTYNDYAILEGSNTGSSNPQTFTGYYDGFYFYQISELNTGCTSFGSFTIETVPNVAPAIVCPADISVSNSIGMCGAYVNYTTPVGTDNCSNGLTTSLEAGPASGGWFPIGTTVVRYRVTDELGAYTECTFNVVVEDTEAPSYVGTSTCPASFTACNPVTWIAPLFQDNCPGLQVTSNHSPGVNFPIGVTPVTYTATDLKGNPTTCTFNVTVLDSSLDATGISSNRDFNNICNGGDVTLTVNGGHLGESAPGVPAQWKWYAGGCGTTPVGTGSSITVSPTATTTYFVRAEGGCRTTACVQLTVVVSSAPPSAAPVYTTLPAQGAPGVTSTLSVAPVPNATYYHWFTTNGHINSVLFNGNTGPWETNVPTVNVSFVLPQQNYQLRVIAGNACGRTSQANTTIRGTVPAPTSMTGPTQACPASPVTYSIQAIPNGSPVTYNWALVPTTAGTITMSANGLSATVVFNAGFGSAQVCANGISSFGLPGPSYCTTVTSSAPVPGAISGNPAPCSGNVIPEIYSITAVPSAISYSWTCSVPGAIVVQAGNGLSASITFPATTFTGTVQVTASSSCGTSAPSVLNITNGVPGNPGNISGATGGLCGAQDVAFSVTTSNALSYLWTVSPGMMIDGLNNLNAVTIDFLPGFSSGTVSVEAFYACGSVIKTHPVSGTPSAPALAPAALCANSFGTFFVTNLEPSTDYTWTTSGDITDEYCSFGSASNCSGYYIETGPAGGSFTVTATNTCGTASTTSDPCRVMAESIDMKLYPNPTNGLVTVELYSKMGGTYKVSITDLSGRQVFSQEFKAASGRNQQEIDLGFANAGMYMVYIKDANGNIGVQKLSVE